MTTSIISPARRMLLNAALKRWSDSGEAAVASVLAFFAFAGADNIAHARKPNAQLQTMMTPTQVSSASSASPHNKRTKPRNISYRVRTAVLFYL
jgi:hypothetical protein